MAVMGHTEKVLNKNIAIVLVAALVILSLPTFMPAYSQISNIDSGCCSNQPLARDFSAFYIGAYRLFHNPSQIYTHGYVNDGEPQIYPRPEQYKYLPSYLLIISPLLLLSYQNAIKFYDVLQFLMLPIIGILVYNLTREKGWAITVIAEILVLLLPSPAPGWGLSVGYFWQWKEGQSKVFETFLLTLALYMGQRQKPVLSGLCLGVAFFDPRFAVVSIPLFATLNISRIRSATKSLAVTLILSNLPFMYPGVAGSFLGMLFTTGLATALYPYAIIPLATIVFLSSVNYYEIRGAMSRILFYRHTRTGSLPESDILKL